MGIFGKKKESHYEGPLVNACRCNPKITYGPENFPHKEFPPPKPPNGQEDLWELQFCRWWGWNWVRKKEIEGMANPVYGTKIEESPPPQRMNPSPRMKRRSLEQSRRTRPQSHRQPSPSPSPQRPPTQKLHCQCYHTRTYGHPNSTLPTKRELKDLCKCIIFQKPSRELPPPELQNLYNTPSHSVVMERERYSFNHQQRFVPCEPEAGHRREKQKKSKCCSSSWCNKPKYTGSSEELICTQPFYQHQNISTQARPASSTEESMEYLTVRMQHVKSDTRCPCQRHIPSKKQSVQTIPPEAPPMEDVACQCTVPETHTKPGYPHPHDINEAYENEKVIKYKGKKKKTLCICVCCCNCCKKDGNGEKTDKNDDTSIKNESTPIREPGSSKKNFSPPENLPQTNFSFFEPEQDNNDIDTTFHDEPKQQKTYVSTFSTPISYHVNRLQESQPVETKQFSKFGNPSKNYSWMKNTFSNDATMSILSDDTFTSPISGKTYNFAALQFHTNEKTKLPDLLDASEDLEYLKSIQSSIRNETEQKILFDAVCDALLTESGTFDEQYKLLDNIVFNNVTKNPNSFSEYSSSYSNLRLPSQEKTPGHTSKVSESLVRSFSDNFIKMPKKSPSSSFRLPQTKISTNESINNVNNDLITKPIFEEPETTSANNDEKETFTNQELNSFIEKVLRVDAFVNSKFLEFEATRDFQLPSTSSVNSAKDNKESVSNKMKHSITKNDEIEKPLVIEKPAFTKTGLLPAEKTFHDFKKPKRSALFSPRESAEFKKSKPDKKLSFDAKKRKVFETNFVPRIDFTNSDYANPFLESEVDKTSFTPNQEVKKKSSLEKVKSSLDNIFTKIDSIIESSKTKNDKLLFHNLPCLSEKSETEDIRDLNLLPENVKPLDFKTVNAKKSYAAFSSGPITNRSGTPKSEILSEHDPLDNSEVKSDNGNENVCKEAIPANNPTFERKSLVTLGIKRSTKRRTHLGKKSLIPVRKKQKN